MLLSDAGALEYSVVVVDTHGAATQIASWAAGTGTAVEATATIGIKAADISRVELHSVAN